MGHRSPEPTRKVRRTLNLNLPYRLGDPATLANQLLCLSDPPAAEEVARRAFEFARTQTWRAVAELYLDLWSSLTAEEAP